MNDKYNELLNAVNALKPFDADFMMDIPNDECISCEASAHKDDCPVTLLRDVLAKCHGNKKWFAGDLGPELTMTKELRDRIVDINQEGRDKHLNGTWATEENTNFTDLSGGRMTYTGDKTATVIIDIKDGDVIQIPEGATLKVR